MPSLGGKFGHVKRVGMVHTKKTGPQSFIHKACAVSTAIWFFVAVFVEFVCFAVLKIFCLNFLENGCPLFVTVLAWH